MSQTISELLPHQLLRSLPDQKHQLELIRNTISAIGAVSTVNELIDNVNRHVAVLFDADLALLMVHDQTHRRFWTRYRYQKDDRDDSGLCIKYLSLDDQQSLCGRVLSTMKPVLVMNASRSVVISRLPHASVEWFDDEPRCLAAAPVISCAGQCDGVLEIMHRRSGHFNQHDLAALDLIAAQVAVTLDHARRDEADQRQLETMLCAAIGAIDARDTITKDNSINVANYAAGIGLFLGLDAYHVKSLRMGALLQDIGKLGTPDRMLTKAGRLDLCEMDEVKKHALYTRHILAKIDFVPPYEDIAELAAAHHEKLDGSGYPDGLVGNQVPLKVRILTVADMFHAFTQPRHYRTGMPLNQAISMLDELVPHQLDERCVAALRTFLGIGDNPTPAA